MAQNSNHNFLQRAPRLSRKLVKQADVVSDLNLEGLFRWSAAVEEAALLPDPLGAPGPRRLVNAALRLLAVVVVAGSW